MKGNQSAVGSPALPQKRQERGGGETGPRGGGRPPEPINSGPDRLWVSRRTVTKVDGYL